MSTILFIMTIIRRLSSIHEFPVRCLYIAWQQHYYRFSAFPTLLTLHKSPVPSATIPATHLRISLSLSLSDQTAEPFTQRTDAFDSYRFSSVSSGTYRLAFADENLINSIDEGPQPDEGTIYPDAVWP